MHPQPQQHTITGFSSLFNPLSAQPYIQWPKPLEETASSRMDKSIEWVRVPNQAPIDGPLPEDEPIVASLAQDDPQTVEDSSEEEVEEEEDKASNSPRGSHASLYESLSIVPTSPRSVSVMSSYVALSLPGSALADVTVEAAHGAQLASAVFISDIEQVLERVWRPALEENGVGVISNLCLSDVLHRCAKDVS